MSNLPDIIAGPILRRVTNNRVCVWLASSKELNFKLAISNQQSKHLGGSEEGRQTSHQLGEKLWVTLFEAWPLENTTFPKDELLYYQLFNGGAEVDLQAVSLNGHSSPSFFIPSQINVLAHGSCRKPHGEALDDDGKQLRIDALSLLGDHIDENSEDLAARPSMLCLTGDQIYADDVATPLINLLKEKAIELMGDELGVPGIDKPSQLGPNKRMEKLVEINSGLTSGEGENHLISFGEYAAMYIYVFGNCAAWQISFKNDDTSKRLKAFTETLAKVRLALANIPTYMMFDDHEISDDWNITRGWYDSVRNSPCGRRIVSNALAAYWAFQGWGNNPETFDREFVRSVRSHLKKPDDANYAERFDLHMWKHRGWGFTVPTSPPIIAMDCRTQRDFDGYDSPARLMDRYALDWLRIAWAQLKTRNIEGTPIIISGSPVLGFDPMEKIQLLAKTFGAKAKDLDLESWIANKQGFAYFMDTLLLKMKLKNVYFLSGDVHYSFVNRAKYEAAGKSLDAIQLTSSAIHNSPSKKSGKFLDWLSELTECTEDHSGSRALGGAPWYKRLVNFFKPHSKRPNAWKTTITGIKPVDGEKLLTKRPNIGLVYFDNGVLSKQRLISGKNGKYTLDYKL